MVEHDLVTSSLLLVTYDERGRRDERTDPPPTLARRSPGRPGSGSGHPVDLHPLRVAAHDRECLQTHVAKVGVTLLVAALPSG